MTKTKIGPLKCYFGVAHPWLCDRLGHLNTRNYVGAFDDATQHLFNAQGLILDEHHGLADVAQSIEYKNEVRIGELFDIEGSVVEVGKKSARYRLEMRLTGTSEIVALCEGTGVLMDLKLRKAVAFPRELFPLGDYRPAH